MGGRRRPERRRHGPHPAHPPQTTRPGSSRSTRRLSPRMRYLRSLPDPTLSASLLQRFVTVDYIDRMALVAVLGDDIIGVACYHRAGVRPQPGGGGVHRRRRSPGPGHGTVLLEHLAAVAADRGLTRFVADTLPSNNRMLGVFRAAGFSDERHFADRRSASAPSSPHPQSVAVVHDREAKAAAASVRRLLQPPLRRRRRSRAGPAGHRPEVFRNLLRSGFAGPAVPGQQEAATSVASVHSYPEPVGDPGRGRPRRHRRAGRRGPAVVDECGTKGVAGLIVISGGFAETGPDGAAASGSSWSGPVSTACGCSAPTAWASPTPTLRCG